MKEYVEVPVPPTFPLIKILPCPAFSVSVGATPEAFVTDPEIVIFAPVEPETPAVSEVESIEVFALKITFDPKVIAFAVKIVPARLKELGEDTVKDPRTLNVSPA